MLRSAAFKHRSSPHTAFGASPKLRALTRTWCRVTCALCGFRQLQARNSGGGANDQMDAGARCTVGAWWQSLSLSSLVFSRAWTTPAPAGEHPTRGRRACYWADDERATGAVRIIAAKLEVGVWCQHTFAERRGAGAGKERVRSARAIFVI